MAVLRHQLQIVIIIIIKDTDTAIDTAKDTDTTTGQPPEIDSSIQTKYCKFGQAVAGKQTLTSNLCTKSKILAV